jgi:chromosomal replication initiation ATPase DnaA
MFNTLKQEVVFKAIEDYCGMPLKLILGSAQDQQPVKARTILAYYLRYFEKLSYPSIGRIIKRDHTTAVVALRNIKKNPELLQEAKLFGEWVMGKIRNAQLP